MTFPRRRQNLTQVGRGQESTWLRPGIAALQNAEGCDHRAVVFDLFRPAARDRKPRSGWAPEVAAGERWRSRRARVLHSIAPTSLARVSRRSEDPGSVCRPERGPKAHGRIGDAPRAALERAIAGLNAAHRTAGARGQTPGAEAATRFKNMRGTKNKTLMPAPDRWPKRHVGARR